MSYYFFDTFDELTDKIKQNSLAMCVPVIQFSHYSVNFIVIFRTIAKISQIYLGNILIWATLDIVCIALSCTIF